MSSKTTPVPIETVLAAFIYTSFNGYLQAQYLCQFANFPSDYLTKNLLFMIGFIIFLSGMKINWESDSILAELCKLRKVKGNNDYLIPYGGGFEYVSAPHYFGELVEWVGFAIASNNSLAGWAFFFYSFSNLVPRAIMHHQWYQDYFGDKYPKNRKAVVPFIW